MRRVRISELRNRLSHYLRYVRRGESVLVYDRDRPIARIDPVRPPPRDDPDWPAELERAGLLRAPTARLPATWLEDRIEVECDVVTVLLGERAGVR